MVQTRNNESSGNHLDAIATQLAAIVAKLDSMKSDVAALKTKSDQQGKYRGSGRFDDGETLGNHGKNPDEFLCSIKQTGSVQEYHRDFTKRSARVFDWPEHCLLGVFLNGLKDDLKAGVQIHKPRTIDDALFLAAKFEAKASDRLERRSKIKEAFKLIETPEEIVDQATNQEEIAEISSHFSLDKTEDRNTAEFNRTPPEKIGGLGRESSLFKKENSSVERVTKSKVFILSSRVRTRYGGDGGGSLLRRSSLDDDWIYHLYHIHRWPEEELNSVTTFLKQGNDASDLYNPSILCVAKNVYFLGRKLDVKIWAWHMTQEDKPYITIKWEPIKIYVFSPRVEFEWSLDIHLFLRLVGKSFVPAGCIDTNPDLDSRVLMMARADPVVVG